MTRLIDADKLIKTVRFLTLRDGKDIEIHYVEAKRVDNAPTIDAIPVEFIRERMNEVEKEFMIVNGLMEAEHDHTYRRAGEYKLLAEYNALRDLIRQWEERKMSESRD